jgi:Flp pilus assembly CpaF family ATPase
MQSLKDITSVNMLRSTYFAFIRSLLRHGILFWGGDGESKKKLLNYRSKYEISLQHIKRYLLQGVV